MSNEWDFVGLRTYVIAHAKKAGIAGSQADLARATGIDETKLSRWFRGVARPSTASLQQLAASVPGLQVDTLMALTGHAGPANAPALPGLPEPSHPVARDLDQLLSPGSPLSEADQDALAAVVSRIVDSFKPPRRRTA